MSPHPTVTTALLPGLIMEHPADAGDQREAQRFAANFLSAWRRLPLGIRSELRAWWGDRSPVVRLKSGRADPTDGAISAYEPDRSLSFALGEYGSMPGEVQTAGIAHELAHVVIAISRSRLSNPDDGLLAFVIIPRATEEVTAWSLVEHWGLGAGVESMATWSQWRIRLAGDLAATGT